MDDVYLELLENFVAESTDFLEEIEPQIVSMAQSYAGSNSLDKETLDIMNSVFRLFHTIKGNAQIFEFNNVSHLAHEAENLLDSIRKQLTPLDHDRLDVLCRTLDLIKAILSKLLGQKHDGGFEDAIEALTGEIGQLNNSKGSEAARIMFDEDGICWVSAPAPLPLSTEAELPPPPPVPALVVSDDIRDRFVQEADELLDTSEQEILSLKSAVNDEAKRESLTNAYRSIHSFKGNCGFMGLRDLEQLTHAAESVLDEFRSDLNTIHEARMQVILQVFDVARQTLQQVSRKEDPSIPKLSDLLLSLMSEDGAGRVTTATQVATKVPVAATPSSAAPPSKLSNDKSSQAKGADVMVQRHDIRVDLRKIDSLIDLVGELVIAETLVTRSPAIAELHNPALDRAVHALRRITLDVQDVSMSVRMIPVAQTFRKMIRIVHDLCAKMQKKVRIEFVGEDTEVDRTIIEKISDPLVHIVRNSMDHGIEGPEDRRKAGKDETGVIRIEARNEGSDVWIIIADDGRGLNREKILKKAIEQGLVKPEEVDEMSESAICQLIFLPGFSTADKLTDVSGRGVGMDVVRKNIEELKGRVHVVTKPGIGSTISFQIPLTLAIIEGMLVRVGNSKYTIPLLTIQESLRPTPEILTIEPDGQELVRIREELIPVLRLHDFLQKTPSGKSLCEGTLVVVNDVETSVAFFVDEILGQQQTIIKSLPRKLLNTKSASGCTILGNGEVSLIIDVRGVMETLKKQYRSFMGSAGV